MSEALQFQLAMAEMTAVAGVNVLTLGHVLGRPYSPIRVWCFALTCAAAALVFGSHARSLGVMIEYDSGYGALGFWLVQLPLTWWIDALMVQIWVAELRGRTDRRELVLCVAGVVLIGIHLAGFACAPIAASYQVSGQHTAFARVQAAIDRDILLY